MSHHFEKPLLDEAELARTLHAVAQDFVRLVGYFGDDGVCCVAQVEAAHAAGDAAALVGPAHRLKGEARQLGAVRLGDIAAEIERTARRCVEEQVPPATITQEVQALRVCFAQTLALLSALTPGRRATRPVAPPRTRRIFGRRAGA